jgi:hypothetical protein
VIEAGGVTGGGFRYEQALHFACQGSLQRTLFTTE